jgi:two-component system nitrate/nitrite response regulator NarL
MMPVEVAIVSELELIAQGVEALLAQDRRIHVTGRFGCSNRAAESLRQAPVDIILASFLCATRTRSLSNLVVPGEVRLIVIADPDDSIDMKQFFRSGVSGVVLTTMPASMLVQSILKVHEGGVWLEKEAVLRHFRREEDGPSLGRLSDREREVFRMAARGLRNREIGERLFISEATVKVHLSNIFEKLQVKNRVELCLVGQKKNRRDAGQVAEPSR